MAAIKSHKKEEYEYGKPSVKEEKPEKPIEKEKPSLALSGNLCKDTNVFNGVIVKYNEPPEARMPKKRWRLYCFKDEKELPFYPMHRQSAYLFGKDRRVADVPIDHPSCSKQHAVFQHRLIEYKRKDNTTGRMIKPYIIDLGSTNGTFVNNQQIEAQRYFELREKDVIKFGFSSREYVLLHEESKNELPEDLSENESDTEPESNEKEEETSKKEIKLEKESVPTSPVHSKVKQTSAQLRSNDSSNESSDSSSDDGDRKKKKFKK